MSDALYQVDRTVGQAINVDSGVAALTGKSTDGSAYYAGEVPDELPVPFVVIGESAQGSFPTFHRRGHDTQTRLHIYAADKQAASRLYGELERVLHLRRLPFDGHTIVRGTLQLVDLFRDKAGDWHGVAVYNVITQEGV